ncbi:YgiT-type zinc finger protein [Candidatus Woesearchaeota archaeon]|nr:YgiT-type zinc finger protein [Candidatus Woesearchaeota archaeon]
MIKCPICEKGALKKVMEKHYLYGVDFGMYPGEKCSSCGEVFTDSSDIKKIEEVAKQKGIWGLGKKTVIARTGNSLAVRIPKGIAEFTGIKEGKEAFIHSEKGRIIIEI